jgi:anti-sigma regulatory factor (Ser/Thr protein kinase)/serine/threonine protein phosphatase PrpC
MDKLDARRYRIRRRSDVQMAAVSVQRDDYYPGLSDLDRAALGTVISELGTNILKYADEGMICISRVQESRRQGILVEAQDQGPGIADVDQALLDHFTTSNTLGLGLPSVQRMSDDLIIHSSPGAGTRVRALRWLHPEPLSAGWPQRTRLAAPRTLPSAMPTSISCSLQHEQRIRPCYPEQVSGDQLLVIQRQHRWLMGVVDGCGHGPAAHTVACAVVASVRESFEQLCPDADPIESPSMSPGDCLSVLLRAAHDTARGSRGAAIGLCLVDGLHSELWFSGIGNTRILLFKPSGWTGVSRDGQLGHRFPTPMIQHFELAPGDTVVQCSDGLRESSVRQLRRSVDPAMPLAELADLLMLQALRADDASVLLMRCLT